MKAIHTIHTALALGVLIAAPALASAQTGNSGQPQQGRQENQPGQSQQDRQERQPGQPDKGKPGQHGTQQRQQSGERPHTQQQQQQQGQKKGSQRIQEQLSMPIDNGCTYTTSVNGKIEHKESSGSHPSGGDTAQGKGAQDRVIPDLTVTSAITCPSAADIRITETLKSDMPVPRPELAEMISRRASVGTAKSGRLCMYVPQFELTDEKLANRGIVQLCRVSAPEGKPQ